jgi:hypothetical protein
MTVRFLLPSLSETAALVDPAWSVGPPLSAIG